MNFNDSLGLRITSLSPLFHVITVGIAFDLVPFLLIATLFFCCCFFNAVQQTDLLEKMNVFHLTYSLGCCARPMLLIASH